MSLPPGAETAWAGAIGDLLKAVYAAEAEAHRAAGQAKDGQHADQVLEKMLARSSGVLVTTLSPPVVANPATVTIDAADDCVLEGLRLTWNGTIDNPGFTASLLMDGVSITHSPIVVPSTARRSPYIPASSLVTRVCPRGSSFQGVVSAIGSSPAPTVGNAITFQWFFWVWVRRPSEVPA